MAKAETELTFYAIIGDRSGFQFAVSSEVQSQYAYFLPRTEDGKPTGQQRVRSTSKNGQIKYEQTLKVPHFNSEVVVFGNTEHTTEITEDFFEAWKKTFQVKGINKIRYVFLSKDVELEAEGQTIKLPEVKYEVDVFLDKDGNQSKWCKIDIEIDNILDYLKEQHPDIKKFDTTVKLSSLPIKPLNAFSGVTENEEEKKAIQNFWDKFSV